MFLILSLCLMLQAPEASVVEPQVVSQTEMQAAFAVQKLELEKQRLVLDTQIKELDLKIREGDFVLEMQVGRWDVYWYSLLGILGISGLGLVYKLRNINAWIDKRLAKKFDDHTAQINAMIFDRNIEERLLQETRVLLLNEDGNRQTLSRLQKWGFKQAWVKALDRYQIEPNPDDYDLILFDQLGKEPIEQLMEALPHRVFVGYSNIYIKDLKHQDRINLANSPMTLFTRVMETAKFAERESNP